jgi:uncharacterized membrane-anchored protein
MPFPPNSTERYQKRWAEERAELNRFRDMMADISQRNRENQKKILPPKVYGASEPPPEFVGPYPPHSNPQSGTGRDKAIFTLAFLVALLTALAFYTLPSITTHFSDVSASTHALVAGVVALAVALFSIYVFMIVFAVMGYIRDHPFKVMIVVGLCIAAWIHFR